MCLNTGTYNVDATECLTLSLAQACPSYLTAYGAHFRGDCSLNTNRLQLSLVHV